MVNSTDPSGNSSQSIEYSFTTVILDTTSPIITIISPINSTYTTSSVNLDYTVDGQTVWECYSLDGAANITLYGNTTLISLIDGVHTLTVYANDTSGNINLSTVWFTIDTTPPAAIANLHPTAGTTWLNWTWTNPPDPDFNHTEVYLNGAFRTITSSEFFNTTDLTPETEYTISTRTVDTAGNINQSWMNDTATTLSASGTTIQLTISLDSGWNLISVPLNLTTWKLGEEAAVIDPLNVTPANSLASIYRYNTTSGSFEMCSHYVGWGWDPIAGSESFTGLEPGRGYWVWAENDCVWNHET